MPGADLELSVPITVLIADDHPLIRAWLRRALRERSDIVLAGEARTAVELLDLVRRRRPDVVVMDLNMPGTAGVEGVVRVLRERPQARVVVLSAEDETPIVDAALAAGARGYIVKSAHPVDLAALVRRVVGGELIRPEAARKPELTERERSILSALATGMTDGAISRELWISEHAISLHLTNIYRKLGVTDRAGALRSARGPRSGAVGGTPGN